MALSLKSFVNLRVSLRGVPKYTSAETLDFLDFEEKSLISTSGTTPFHPDFPEGNELECPLGRSSGRSQQLNLEVP